VQKISLRYFLFCLYGGFKNWDLRCMIIQFDIKKKKILQNYLEGNSVITQAQLLHSLLKQKCLRNAIKLLGIKGGKEVKTNETVSKKVTSTLATFARKCSRDLMIARRALLIGIVAKNNCN